MRTGIQFKPIQQVWNHLKTQVNQLDLAANETSGLKLMQEARLNYTLRNPFEDTKGHFA
jgi:hypothetical protein